jgi:hypothetical protein
MAEGTGILYSAFEPIYVIRGSSIKFLQALRTSTKVEDAPCVFDPNGIGCRLLSQANRTDFQRGGLLQAELWVVNE